MVRKSRFELPQDAEDYVAFLKEASQRRRRESKVCPSCGTTFTKIRKAIYCSPACRQRAYYRQRRQAARASEDRP